MKKKLTAFIVMLFLTILIVIYIFYSFQSTKNYVKYGVLDVSASLNQQKVVPLDGTWDFYWKEFLTPQSDFTKYEDEKKQILVPQNWKYGAMKSAYGFGTYKIILNHLQPNEQYAIIKQNIRIASKIYVDGKLLCTDGNPAQNETNEIIGNMPQVITFIPKTSKSVMLIQISNYEFYSGGIIESIQFGKSNDIIAQQQKEMTFEMGIFTSLIVIGLIFFVIFMFFSELRKTEAFGFFLPFTILAFAVVNGSIGERMIKVLIPNMPTIFMIRLEYFMIGIFSVFLFLAIHSMERKFLPKWITFFLVILYSSFSISAIFIPLKWAILWSVISYSVTILMPAIFLYGLFQMFFGKGIKIEIEEQILVLSILYCVNIYSIDLMLFTIGIKHTKSLSLIAAVLYGVVWFFLISYRIYKANLILVQAEEELQVKNDELEVHQNEILAAYEHMEMLVEERTKELSLANEQLQIEVEQRQKNEAKIERLAFYDQLTDIPNRRYFQTYFDEYLKKAQEEKKTFTLLFLDLDGFKKVNDTYGHDVGDILLKMVSNDLKEALSAHDFLSRLGGDEFVILLDYINRKEEIEQICEELIQAVTSKKQIKAHEVYVGISIGIVSYPKNGDTKEQLIKKADFAMYEAKKQPQSMYVFA